MKFLPNKNKIFKIDLLDGKINKSNHSDFLINSKLFSTFFKKHLIETEKLINFSRTEDNLKEWIQKIYETETYDSTIPIKDFVFQMERNNFFPQDGITSVHEYSDIKLSQTIDITWVYKYIYLVYQFFADQDTRDRYEDEFIKYATEDEKTYKDFLKNYMDLSGFSAYFDKDIISFIGKNSKATINNESKYVDNVIKIHKNFKSWGSKKFINKKILEQIFKFEFNKLKEKYKHISHIINNENLKNYSHYFTEDKCKNYMPYNILGIHYFYNDYASLKKNSLKLNHSNYNKKIKDFNDGNNFRIFYLKLPSDKWLFILDKSLPDHRTGWTRPKPWEHDVMYSFHGRFIYFDEVIGIEENARGCKEMARNFKASNVLQNKRTTKRTKEDIK